MAEGPNNTARADSQFDLNARYRRSWPTKPHNLKSPIHRFNSLSTHTDWFRFWLQGYEDPSPKKKEQYARWRKMRAEWEAAKQKAEGRKQ